MYPQQQKTPPITLNVAHHAPREHYTAPSATDAPTARNPNPPNPRPGSTTLHLRQQMRASTDLIAAPTRAEGTQHCTLGDRNPCQSP